MTTQVEEILQTKLNQKIVESKPDELKLFACELINLVWQNPEMRLKLIKSLNIAGLETADQKPKPGRPPKKTARKPRQPRTPAPVPVEEPTEDDIISDLTQTIPSEEVKPERPHKPTERKDIESVMFT